MIYSKLTSQLAYLDFAGASHDAEAKTYSNAILGNPWDVRWIKGVNRV